MFGPLSRIAPAMSCATIAPESCASSQTHDELQRPEQPADLRQQPEHDEAEAEVVRLGQRVQAGERVGKAQQPDRAGHEEEDSGRDREDGEEVERRGSFALLCLGTIALRLEHL